jgi:hypothetical protein
MEEWYNGGNLFTSWQPRNKEESQEGAKIYFSKSNP